MPSSGRGDAGLPRPGRGRPPRGLRIGLERDLADPRRRRFRARALHARSELARAGSAALRAARLGAVRGPADPGPVHGSRDRPARDRRREADAFFAGEPGVRALRDRGETGSRPRAGRRRTGAVWNRNCRDQQGMAQAPDGGSQSRRNAAAGRAREGHRVRAPAGRRSRTPWPPRPRNSTASRSPSGPTSIPTPASFDAWSVRRSSRPSRIPTAEWTRRGGPGAQAGRRDRRRDPAARSPPTGSAASPPSRPSRSSTSAYGRPSARRSTTSSSTASARSSTAPSSASSAATSSSTSAAPRRSSPAPSRRATSATARASASAPSSSRCTSSPRARRSSCRAPTRDSWSSLFEMEVPEIYDGTVVIKAAVRAPGERAKVAVYSRERDVDPVGACVGMKGSRVQAIIRELRGEKIDIIEYSRRPGDLRPERPGAGQDHPRLGASRRRPGRTSTSSSRTSSSRSRSASAARTSASPPS